MTAQLHKKNEELYIKMLRSGGRRLHRHDIKGWFSFFLWKGPKLISSGYSQQSSRKAFINLIENYAKSFPQSRIAKILSK